jgi:hypothetical protein
MYRFGRGLNYAEAGNDSCHSEAQDFALMVSRWGAVSESSNSAISVLCNVRVASMERTGYDFTFAGVTYIGSIALDNSMSLQFGKEQLWLGLSTFVFLFRQFSQAMVARGRRFLFGTGDVRTGEAWLIAMFGASQDLLKLDIMKGKVRQTVGTEQDPRSGHSSKKSTRKLCKVTSRPPLIRCYGEM